MRRVPLGPGLIVLALAPFLQSAVIDAQAPATAASSAVARPLLWSIGKTNPSYLFGTIHVPDERVVTLGPAVTQAFDAASAVFTEIPMDAATQMGVLGKVLLPGEQTLSEVVGAPLAERLNKAIEQTLPKDAPAGTAAMVAKFLSRMKPWAAMTQLSLLEFLPDMMAGRQPLDKMLWDRAVTAGKETGSLETVDEQLAVFDRFPLSDQKRMLELTLDELEEGRRKPKTLTQELIEAYLTGDLDVLTRLLNDTMKTDRELMTRVTDAALYARNEVMATRIRERLGARPGKSCFFAVGAAHYAGDRGVVALLVKAGIDVTRVP